MALQFQCAKDVAQHWQDPMYLSSEGSPFNQAFGSSVLVPTGLKGDMDESPKSSIVKGRFADAGCKRAEGSRLGG